MPRFFAVDTHSNNEVMYIGTTDKQTGEWTECDEKLLEKVRGSAQKRLSQKLNELMNLDPTVPVVTK